MSPFTCDNGPQEEPNSPADAGIQGQNKQGQYEEAQCHALLPANAFNAQDDNQEPCGKHEQQPCQNIVNTVGGLQSAGEVTNTSLYQQDWSRRQSNWFGSGIYCFYQINFRMHEQ